VRTRVAAILVVIGLIWAAWGVFIYRPAPDAMAACVSNGQLACSTVDGFPLGTLVQDCGGQPDVCGDDAVPAQGGLRSSYVHRALVHSAKYGLDMARFCGPVVCALTGPYNIFVFDFADGSRQAVAVSCPGVGDTCRAVQSYTAGSGL
jgi:hypothetical protein